MSVTINLPEDVNLSNFEVSMILASKLFEEGKISSGQGAKIVGISKRTFLELLSEYGVSIFDDNNLELLKDWNEE